jgi:hypothetical protein
VKQLKESLSKVIVTDADFRETFTTARSSKPDLARYYLRALEAAAANESEPWYVLNDDQDTITVEHVLPKNAPKGTWGNFEADDARRYLKRLGNLCLLQRSKNSNIDNDDFATKKRVFGGSPLVFTNQIEKIDDWSPVAVEARQRAMADMAIRAWPI